MRGRTRKYVAGYAFILPWVLGLTFFIAYPFFAAAYFSFCDFPPLKDPMLIGTDNYAELLGDPTFIRCLGVTTTYAAVAIPLGVLLALSLAMFLNARVRGQTFYRVIFYLPHLVPTVVVAVLWLWIFNPEAGLLNLVLGMLVDAGDWWTGRFFDLQALQSGTFALRWGALALPGAAALAIAAWGPVARRIWARRPPARRLVAALAVLAIILAAVAILSALAYCSFPEDMKKLHAPAWLTDGDPMPAGVSFAPSWALWALIIMSMWGVGQMAVIYLAKLQDVPVELYEAADIDGANWWQKMRNITIPMISPVILFNVVMAIIGAFQVFAQPYIMTQGGPEDKTRFVAMFVYDQAFQYHRLGYASAVAAVLFLVIVAMTLLAFRLSKKHVHYAGR